MKQYLIILMAILALTSVLLVGCAQEAELESRITILETKLRTAESSIIVLQRRIEKLEQTPQKTLTEEDILRTLEGKNFGVTIKTLPPGYIMWRTWIVFDKWFDD